jgi:hypothetical protein
MEEKAKTKSILMWEVTSPWADFLFNVSNVVLIVGAAAVFIGSIGSIKMASVREEFSNERISANEAATARAVADSDIAIARQKEAELKLAQLEKKLIPRVINDEQATKLVARLSRFSGVAFAVEADTAAEFAFVNRIITLLQRAGWIWKEYSSRPNTLPLSAPPGIDFSDLSGVQIRINALRKDDFQKPAFELAATLTDVMGKTVSFVTDDPKVHDACSPDEIHVEIYRML